MKTLCLNIFIPFISLYSQKEKNTHGCFVFQLLLPKQHGIVALLLNIFLRLWLCSKCHENHCWMLINVSNIDGHSMLVHNLPDKIYHILPNKHDIIEIYHWLSYSRQRPNVGVCLSRQAHLFDEIWYLYGKLCSRIEWPNLCYISNDSHGFWNKATI